MGAVNGSPDRVLYAGTVGWQCEWRTNLSRYNLKKGKTEKKGIAREEAGDRRERLRKKEQREVEVKQRDIESEEERD
eukprot:1336875-Amorphochlora_amoeboformis.AAC.1